MTARRRLEQQQFLMTRTDWRRIAVSRCLCGLVASTAGVPCFVLIYVWTITLLVPFPEQVNKFETHPYHHTHAHVSKGLNDAIAHQVIIHPQTQALTSHPSFVFPALNSSPMDMG